MLGFVIIATAASAVGEPIDATEIVSARMTEPPALCRAHDHAYPIFDDRGNFHGLYAVPEYDERGEIVSAQHVTANRLDGFIPCQQTMANDNPSNDIQDDAALLF